MSRRFNADIRPFIKDGFINMSYRELNEMVNRTSQKKVCSSLAIAIKRGLLRYPYKRYFMQNPVELLDNRTRSEIIHFPYVNDLLEFQANENRLYNGEEIALLFYDDYYELDIITEYFTQYARVRAKMKKNTSPIKFWKTAANFVAKKVINKCLVKDIPLNTEVISDGIFYTKIKPCTNFKISVVMKVCNYFQATAFFDPFAGWGDRAIGAMLSDTVTSYVGTDPNTTLKNGYTQICKFFREHRSDKRVEFHNLPIEDFNLEQIHPNPDLIFSSPPFFDYEIYSDEETQSINRYPDKDLWINDWFIPQTLRIWEYLRDGGRLIYHLNDVNINVIDLLIETMPENALFEGQIPVTREMTGTGELDGKKMVNPVFMYIWKKI